MGTRKVNQKLSLGIIFLFFISFCPAYASTPALRTCAAFFGMALPTSRNFDFWFEEDPLFRNGLMIAAKPRIKPESIAGFEMGYILEFIRLFPERAKKLGITLRSDGTIVYPFYYGINERIKLWRKEGDPRAPQILFKLDTSNGEPNVEKFAEDWANGFAHISLNGKTHAQYGDEISSLHVHDMFVHLPAYVVIPGEITLANQKMTSVALRLTKADIVQKDPRLKKSLKKSLTSLVQEIDYLPVEFLQSFLHRRPRRESELATSVAFHKLSHIAFRTRSLLQTIDDHLYHEPSVWRAGTGVTPGYQFIQDTLAETNHYPAISFEHQLELLSSLEAEVSGK